MKILLIEDDEILVKALKTALEKEAYTVDFFTNGEDAEKRIMHHHEQYDLIVLDWMLPDKAGVDICQSVREKGIHTPILVLTGKEKTEDKVQALNAGADDYLTKPFSSDELMARVRAILRRPKATVPVRLAVKDIVLDSTTRRVFRGDKEIILSLKEFGILEYLMRHSNQVVSRDELLEHVWDFAFDSFSNIVDVHITNLRKKIQNSEKETIIETVRGVGYRIKA
jgi:DNA-binding response OmpR family regulator